MKYPFIVSEIFGAENEILINYLFDKYYEEQVEDIDEEGGTEKIMVEQGIEKEQIRKTLLPTLMIFLETDYLNQTSAGYFNKTFQSIIKKRGYSFWEYITLRPLHLSNFMKHLDVGHIADIVERLIILDTTEEPHLNTYIEARKTLLKRVFNIMKNKYYSPEIVFNCANIINSVITK